jgi:hypothetical protein
VVAVEDGVFEILSQSRDTHESPTAHIINQKVVQFIVDALDPFYALDPVEACQGSLNYLLQSLLIQHRRKY